VFGVSPLTSADCRPASRSRLRSLATPSRAQVQSATAGWEDVSADPTQGAS
jgi:hypothetical protein